MLVIGVTGGLASGKSEAAKIIHQLTNAPIINADKIGHDLIKPKSKIWKKIIKVFGKYILNKSNSINRKLLGEIVFSSKTELNKLEKILHPPIKAVIKKEIAKNRKHGEKMVVIDAPLLIEANLLSIIDKIIIIDSFEKLQLKRYAGKNKAEKLKASKIIAIQMPLKEKLKFADFCIKNNSSLKELKIKIKNLLDKL